MNENSYTIKLGSGNRLCKQIIATGLDRTRSARQDRVVY